MRKPPAEIVASALAVTTLFIPHHLPPWAIFIGWAGTFAAGGPKPEILKRIWPTMALGNCVACLIVLGFGFASTYLSGTALTIAQCAILFCLNGSMMALGRFELFSFVPGMFFGFACFFATYFGGFGPMPKDPLMALLSVLVMNALGPVYAWLTASLGSHHPGRPETSLSHPVAH